MLIKREGSTTWKSIQSMNIVLHEKTISETPNFDVKESSDGKLNYGVEYKHRDIEVKVLVNEENKEHYKLRINQLNNYLIGSFSLCFSENPEYIYRDVVLVSHSEREKISDYASIITLKMKAYDPFLYSEVLIENNYVNITEGVVKTITNLGTYIAKPIIELSGTAKMVTLSIGEKTTTYFNLEGDSIVTIDCEDYLVYKEILEERVNALENWRGDFIYLSPGENSLVINGINMNVSVKVKFRYTFL